MDTNTPALPNFDGIPKKFNEFKTSIKEISNFKVSGVFTDHMVIQRDCPIKIWGFSNKVGMAVTGSFGDETSVTTVTEDNRFVLEFGKRTMSKIPSTIIVKCDEGEAVIKDVLIGDVFIIGGQSNGEHNLSQCIRFSPEVEKNISEKRNIRLFSQTQAGAFAHKEEQLVPQADVLMEEWHWRVSDVQSALGFSAIGYYIADIIEREIDIPIGVIMMCPGGACVRELMPVELANKQGYFDGANVPCGGYYNTMISPFIGLGFAAQIFYQGESEGIWDYMAYNYDNDLKALVDDERERFGFDFPFYNFQLCSYRDECATYFQHLEWVRVKQFDAEKIIDKYKLCVTRDQGSLPEDPDWAHSPHKEIQAIRMADIILADFYHKKELSDVLHPYPVKLERKGNKAIITFESCNKRLLTSDGGKLKGFACVTEAREVVDTDAIIVSENQVEVTVLDDKKYTGISFALSSKAYLEQANLINEKGIPAPAFLLTF